MYSYVNIPESALDAFCFYLKDKIIEFYKNPENQAEFEKWLSERNIKSGLRAEGEQACRSESCADPLNAGMSSCELPILQASNQAVKGKL